MHVNDYFFTAMPIYPYGANIVRVDLSDQKKATWVGTEA